MQYEQLRYLQQPASIRSLCTLTEFVRPFTHRFWNLHSRCNRRRTIQLIRSKNLNWGTTPPKLRLSQHLSVLFVPLKVSQVACWEKAHFEVVSFRPPKNDFRFSSRKTSKLLLDQGGMKQFLATSAHCAHWIPSKLPDPTRFFPLFYFFGKSSKNFKKLQKPTNLRSQLLNVNEVLPTVLRNLFCK